MHKPLPSAPKAKKTWPAEAALLVDELWYLQTNPDVAEAGLSAIDHYMSIGWAEGRNPCPLFDTEWYFRQYPDVELSGMNPLVHYCQHGWRERRSPHPLLDVEWYAFTYPDTQAVNPVLHFKNVGAAKGLMPHPLFETGWYVKQHPEAAKDPIAHYLKIGASRALNPHPLFDAHFYTQQARPASNLATPALVHYLTTKTDTFLKPHPLFDPKFYAQRHHDVGLTDEALLVHFLKSTSADARQPCLEFDTEWYLQTYQDVAKSGMNPLRHFVVHGAREKRNPSPNFDTAYYLEANPDVAATGINALVHFVLKGQKEGRSPKRPLRPATEAKQNDISLNIGPAFSHLHGAKSAILKAFLERSKTPGEPVPESLRVLAKEIISKSPQKPRVSVIMPVWNRSHSVCESLTSALKQSYMPHEIIVSDDGSEDDTVEKIKAAFPAEIKSGTIKILLNAHHGVSAARNSGLRAATGDIIAYLDSDNKWRQDYLLFASAVFAETPEICTIYAALESNNLNSGEVRIRATPYDRRRLLSGNFIDLNVFSHRHRIYEQLGGFDEKLTRLVDWDLIARYTKLYTPVYLPFIGVDYYLDREALKNITFTESLEKNFAAVAFKNFQERIRLGVDQLRIAYFVYDYPALSQTFVLNEIRWLVENGFDIKVFYATTPERRATLDFEVEAIHVRDSIEFAAALAETNRNICHGHFAYPGVTNFVMPACQSANVHYTFMPHAVDIFHNNNRDRSRLAEISNNPNCLRVFVYGDHHRAFLESKGVDRQKISYNFQAITPSDFEIKGGDVACKSSARLSKGLVVARFIEKKGIEYLIEAADLVRDLQIKFAVYGYGPLHDSYQLKLRQLGLTNFEFPGPLEDRDSLSSAYREADFLVAPCVEAENGDIDGFPTVILEAISAEKPVITTAVSAIPDYLRNGIEALIAEPRDARSLAEKIRELFNLTEAERKALTNNAKAFVEKYVGVDNTMRRFLDAWSGYEVDLFLVTYNTPKYEDRIETFEIIRRLLAHTTTTFTLTIVDNASAPDFICELRHTIKGHANVRLIENDQNLFCGPASNMAVRHGGSEFAIYICSKEGFVCKHGWERPLIEKMRSQKHLPIAGYKTHLPRFTMGRELLAHPDFPKFRNQDFAINNPDRAFKHIQGGVYIIRRDTFEKFGWFSDLLPQNLMDVEYSYLLESQGAVLGEIPELRSLSIKTLPQLTSILDESTVIAHPLSNENVIDILDRTNQKKASRCNLCGSDDLVSESGAVRGSTKLVCLVCGSTPFGRSVGRLVAHDHRTHRGSTCVCASQDLGLRKFLSNRLFKLAACDDLLLPLEPERMKAQFHVQMLIVDLDELGRDDAAPVLEELVRHLSPGAALIVGGQSLNLDMLTESTLSKFDAKISAVSKPSRYLGLDWRPIALIERGISAKATT